MLDTFGKMSELHLAMKPMGGEKNPQSQMQQQSVKTDLDVIQDLIDVCANHLDSLRTQCAISSALTQQEIRELETKLIRYFTDWLHARTQQRQNFPTNEQCQSLAYAERNALKQWLHVVGLSPNSLEMCVERLSSFDELLLLNEVELQHMLQANPDWSNEELRRLTQAMKNLNRYIKLMSGCSAKASLPKDWFWDSWDQQSRRRPSATRIDRSMRALQAQTPTKRLLDVQKHSSSQNMPMPSPPNSPYAQSSSGTGGDTSTSSTGTPQHGVDTHTERSSLISAASSTQTESTIQDALTDSLTELNGRNWSGAAEINSSDAGSDISMENNNASSTMLQVPCSPGMVGMGHSIKHNFIAVLRIRSTCDLCQKQMFLGLKCRECKYRCHKDCQPNVPPSCGLPPQYFDEFKHTVIKDQPFGFTAMAHTSPSLKKVQLARQYGDSSSQSSSSCTSSTPSSPAPAINQLAGSLNNSMVCSSTGSSTNLLPTPSAYYGKQQMTHFNFPDVRQSMSSINSNEPHANKTLSVLITNEQPTHQQSINNNNNSINNNVSLNLEQSIGSEYSQTASSYSGCSSKTSTLISSVGSVVSVVSSARKLSSVGAQTETQKSYDSEKTISLSCSNSASTDSDRTPVRVDSTEDQDSDNWRRQNSVSYKEWDIPYGDLRLLEHIGSGRFGTVYRALWHGDVAVKLLNEDYLNDEHTLEAFKLEVANFKKTRHDNLVLFMGACMNPPHLAIVTALCKGSTLYALLHNFRENFTMNRVLIVAQQIAQGMGYLHARGILHKDLRSKNIFLENGKVIITDFGLFSSTKLRYHEKGLGIPINWLCYVAPELMRALQPRKPCNECLPFSQGSDVYAFGTVWYELICGEFAFRSEPAESVIWRVGRGMKHTLANIQTGRDVKDLLMLCWAYQADDRPDFSRLLQLLEHLPKKRLARSPSHPVNLSRSAESMF